MPNQNNDNLPPDGKFFSTEDLSEHDRQERAKFVDRLERSASMFGEDFIQKFYFVLDDVEDDYYPGEFREQRRRLRNGLKRMVKATHEPSNVENIYGDKYEMQSGATQCNMNLPSEADAAKVLRLIKANEGS